MPLQRTQTAKGVSALAALLRRRAKAKFDRAKLDGLMEQVARLRESGECSSIKGIAPDYPARRASRPPSGGFFVALPFQA